MHAMLVIEGGESGSGDQSCKGHCEDISYHLSASDSRPDITLHDLDLAVINLGYGTYLRIRLTLAWQSPCAYRTTRGYIAHQGKTVLRRIQGRTEQRRDQCSF